MYVCICQQVTDSEIRAAAASGVRSFRQLQTVTGCSTGCGKCAGEARDLLLQSTEDERSDSCFPMFLSPA